MNCISVDSSSCSGCSSCKAICSKCAIKFIDDKEGFKIPYVDKSSCVDCGLCLQTCPAIHNYVNNSKVDGYKAYAFQYKVDESRFLSASGGVFPAFAAYFIEELNGYVCGCILDDDLTPRHIVSNDKKIIVRMQDSKYVQSDMGDCFCEMATLLKKGCYVFFSGTSCQVAGLYSYLHKRNITTQKLLTIDFFCHGVPSPKVWKDYINFYEKRYDRTVSSFRFRSKKWGWGPSSRGTSYLSSINYIDNGSKSSNLKTDRFTFASRMWPRVLFSNLAIRGYCHSCPYTNIEKPADITMGDFWGIQKFYPQFSDGKGCSVIIVRNEDTVKMLNKLSNVDFHKVNLENAIAKQGNAFKPSKPNPNRQKFWEDYNDLGFEFVAKKYFRFNTLDRVKNYIKYFLFVMHLRNYQK